MWGRRLAEVARGNFGDGTMAFLSTGHRHDVGLVEVGADARRGDGRRPSTRVTPVVTSTVGRPCRTGRAPICPRRDDRNGDTLVAMETDTIDRGAEPTRRTGTRPWTSTSIRSSSSLINMAATLAFYRALGVQIPDEAIWRTSTGIHHVHFTMPSGLIIHFDSPRLAASYNTGWREPIGTGSGNMFSFKVAERDEMDELHRRLTDLGHPSPQGPYDTFGSTIRDHRRPRREPRRNHEHRRPDASQRPSRPLTRCARRGCPRVQPTRSTVAFLGEV